MPASPAPVIVRVADLQTMTVWAQVAEADVVKVKAGTPVYFSTLGAPEKTLAGQGAASLSDAGNGE